MSQCQKCGQPLKFVKRLFGDVLKWCPVNLDGSDHWDDCKRATRKRLMGESVEKVMAYAENACPTFWTFPDDKGGRRRSATKPEWWDAKPQPAPIEELF